jgi:protein-disulfide isomerase
VNRWILALVALIGVGAGALGVTAWNNARLPADRGAIEQVVHDYLMAHPEVIPAAMQRLQQREASRAASAAGSAITRPYAGAWAGNPRGDVTLVEYYDYNCGYCRASLPILRRLIASDPNVRVVFRELPVLAESSRAAAEASLAAAAQGSAKFNRFHEALYAGGRVTDASIAAAARAAGVDLSKLDRRAADAEIARNMEAAARLGINGTPSWVIGDQVVSGALPFAGLQKAVADARKALRSS